MTNNLLELTPIQYSASAIKVLHFEIEPNRKCFRLHWHDRMELLRINRGKLLVEYGTGTAELSAGELMILPPKMLHKGYTADDAVEYDVIMFDVRSFYNETEVCKHLLPAIFDGRLSFKCITADPETLGCFDDICKNSDKDSLLVTSKIYRLLYLFYENNLLEFRAQPKSSPVKEIIDYMEKNFAEELNTAALCEKFGYTSAHFCRKFKKATGLSPMTYLKIYRLETARKKIKSRDLSIGEIASECGFTDANYFTRCFKAHFGVSPTYYRR